MSPEKQALSAFWSHKRFWLLQTLAIAIWTALALSWFWLPDSSLWGLALATVQGLAVLGGALWLIRTALVFYSRSAALRCSRNAGSPVGNSGCSADRPHSGHIVREGAAWHPAQVIVDCIVPRPSVGYVAVNVRDARSGLP